MLKNDLIFLNLHIRKGEKKSALCHEKEVRDKVWVLIGYERRSILCILCVYNTLIINFQNSNHQKKNNWSICNTVRIVSYSNFYLIGESKVFHFLIIKCTLVFLSSSVNVRKSNLKHNVRKSNLKHASVFWVNVLCNNYKSGLILFECVA